MPAESSFLRRRLRMSGGRELRSRARKRSGRSVGPAPQLLAGYVRQTSEKRNLFSSSPRASSKQRSSIPEHTSKAAQAPPCKWASKEKFNCQLEDARIARARQLPEARS